MPETKLFSYEKKLKARNQLLNPSDLSQRMLAAFISEGCPVFILKHTLDWDIIVIFKPYGLFDLFPQQIEGKM
jgi:hypothetical protein